MRIIKKEITVPAEKYHSVHLNMINPMLPVQLSEKEIAVLSSFMSLDYEIIKDDMFNTLARKLVKEKLEDMSSSSLSNHIRSLLTKGYLSKDAITGRITLKKFLIPEDDWQGYMFKITKE